MSRFCEECWAAAPVDEDGICAECAVEAARRAELAGIVAQAREAAVYARAHGTVSSARCENCAGFMGRPTDDGLCTLCATATAGRSR